VGLKAVCVQKQDLEDTENYKKSRFILSLDENATQWDVGIIERVKSLWEDEGVRETWKEIKDNTLVQLDYLMENFDRYLDEEFIPTYDDILRARQRTTGVAVYQIEEERTIWELTDVGGQYSERLKWGSFFQDKVPNAIIFFLAIDEYNVPNTELKTEGHKTKFDLSLSIFGEIMCNDGLVVDHKLCRIVFLNKVDLFQEKLSDEKKWMDFKQIMGYTGSNKIHDCTKFIEQKILEINNNLKEKHENEMDLKIHITNALDTSLMEKISTDIKTSIVTYTLKDIGML